MWRLSWVSLAVYLIDQLTKYFATDFLLRQGPTDVTPFLNLVLVHNTGAAFGFLSGADGWQNLFFIFVALVASIFILWMIARLHRHELLLAMGLMLILGGALGNLTDRLIHGYVIDFIDVHYRAWHWPAFNVADSAISVGAVLLVMDAIGMFRRKQS